MTDPAMCPRCSKRWINGTCDDTVSRRALCARKAREFTPSPPPYDPERPEQEYVPGLGYRYVDMTP